MLFLDGARSCRGVMRAQTATMAVQNLRQVMQKAGLLREKNCLPMSQWVVQAQCPHSFYAWLDSHAMKFAAYQVWAFFVGSGFKLEVLRFLCCLAGYGNGSDQL